jgi:hypothetical protein
MTARRNANTGLSRIPPAIVHQAQFGKLSIFCRRS